MKDACAAADVAPLRGPSIAWCLCAEPLVNVKPALPSVSALRSQYIGGRVSWK